jgi:putative peptidoglycan lipid II flippase
MEQEKRIIKSAGTLGAVATVSRIFGYFRDAAMAWVLGAGFGMDAFAVAYRLANLFRRLVAEGSMSSVFVPVFVAYREGHSREELWDFARKFFYALTLVTGLIVAAQVIFAPLIVGLMAPGFVQVPGKWELTVFLTRLMAPYLLFVALAAFFRGILNSYGRFALPAFSSVYFNLAVIASAFLIVPWLKEPAAGIAIGVLIGGALQWLSQLPAVIRCGMSFRFGISLSHPEIRKVGKLMAPGILGTGVLQINLVVASLMASFLREGSVSHLYYADRIMELVLGIFVVSLTTVTVPEMARSAARNQMGEVKSTLMFSLRSISFVAIPATVGLFLLSDPIVHVLFERGRFTALDTERTAAALAYFSVGLCFIAANRILVSAFYALQDTKTPVQIASISLAANALLNWALMHPLKEGGIALATSLAAVLSVVQLVWIFEKRFGALDWMKFRESVLRIALSSAVMGFSALVFLRIFQFHESQELVWKLAGLFGTIVLSVLIYIGACLLFRVDELALLKNIPMKVKSQK